MKDVFLKIFSSPIMHSVIVPIVIVFLGWIKNKHDVKEKNKELGYWMIKCRRLHTFVDDAMVVYKLLAINLIIIQIPIFIIRLWKGGWLCYVVIGIIYFSVSALCVFIVSKCYKIKVEFLTNGKSKKALLIFLYVIYGIPFFLQIFPENMLIMEAVFFAFLITWVSMLFRCCDVVYILDNKYADIYVKGSEKAQFAEAGSIKKQGEWIIVNRFVNAYDEEIRIRENDIVRIDYYGGPMISVEKRRLFRGC